MKMTKFASIPRLERLNLEGCTSFCNLQLSVGAFHEMSSLTKLNLGRTGIKELPSVIGSLSSLEILKLSRCSKLEKFPEIQGNMKCIKFLYLDRTAIKEFPNSISCLEALRGLYLGCCSNLRSFLRSQKGLWGA